MPMDIADLYGHMISAIDRSDRNNERVTLEQGRWTTKAVTDAFAEINEQVALNGAAAQVAVEKIGAANSLATEKVGAAGQLATEKIGAANQLSTEKVGAANAAVTASIGSQIQNLMIGGFKDALLQACQNTDNITGQVQSVGKDLGLALVTGFKDQLIRSFQGEAAIQAQAASNFAAIQAQAAECCCEIKTMVVSDGQKTRDLVQSFKTADDLRRFNALSDEISYLKSRVPNGTPV